MFPNKFTTGKEKHRIMKLIEQILETENMMKAAKKVKENNGVAGVDNVPVFEIDKYVAANMQQIRHDVMTRKYKPQPVKRVYIPKSNGKKRPLGIPTALDRVIQQAIAQVLVEIYDKDFSESSYGFRPNRNAHQAIEKTLKYMNEGYTWIIDLDIEAYFDTINHDKAISIIREKVNDSTTLHYIRKFMQAGIMEKGLVKPSIKGVPQGGPLSPIISNIYLDKLDKELEAREIRFARYADDVNIFLKSQRSAERVMKSITKWLENKMFLKVSETKTKIVKPANSIFLGFAFYKSKEGWQCAPSRKSKMNLYNNCRKELVRKICIATSNQHTFTRINQIVKGWINYYKIGHMKRYMDEFGQWLRHKIRVIIIKQWKEPQTIYRNLQLLNRKLPYHFSEEQVYAVANSRLGWYKRANGNVVNFLLNADVLAIRKGKRPGLVNPLKFYLVRFKYYHMNVAPYTRPVRTVQ